MEDKAKKVEAIVIDVANHVAANISAVADIELDDIHPEDTLANVTKQDPDKQLLVLLLVEKALGINVPSLR